MDWVEQFHALVDEASAPVAEANADRLTCKQGCHDCCTDGLTVFPIEAAVIERHFSELLQNGEPSPSGCAFLDESGSCRIYEHRPYVCRTQGLPLRWVEEEDDGDGLVETRDICPLNEEGTPLEQLEAEACWTLGPFEERLAKRQGTRQRVPLRSLFARRLPVLP